MSSRSILSMLALIGVLATAAEAALLPAGLLPGTAETAEDAVQPPPPAPVPLPATEPSPTGPPVPAGDVAALADDKDETKRLKSQFKNLRFEEDWSALADPEVETDHWFPAAKHVDIGDDGDWTASFGGQIRYQYKADHNRSLTGTVPGDNTFSLLRMRLHGDLRLRDEFRAFVELLDASIDGNEAPATPIDRNQVDLLNAFVEFFGDDSSMRIGRTEMQYGAQRLISPLDWGNTRRTFEGGVFKVKNDELTTDVFAVHPVTVDPTHADNPDSSRWLVGTYNTYVLGPGAGVDGYLLLLDEDNDQLSPAPGAPLGDMAMYTYGARLWGKEGLVDWEAEAARQTGDFAGSRIRADMVTLRAGRTFDDCAGKPRVGLDFDYASGDDDNTDSTRTTFNQLYPLGHAYFGYLDLVGRQNIMQIMPNVVWQTSETTSFRVSYSDFELADDDDFLYNASGAPSSPATALGTGTDVGHEVDFTLTWNPTSMAPHGVWLFGYSEFEPGTFVDGYGDGENARLLYVQYTFTF
jgi:hypothetical protein